MKTTIILIPLLLLCIVFSCKSKVKLGSTEPKVEKTLVIEFFSRGSGIDHESRKALDSLLSSNSEIDCQYRSSINKQGREGEREYCLIFTDSTCYNKAFSVITNKLAKKDLVRLHTDRLCKK
jgi:hypothetical protein